MPCFVNSKWGGKKLQWLSNWRRSKEYVHKQNLLYRSNRRILKKNTLVIIHRRLKKLEYQLYVDLLNVIENVSIAITSILYLCVSMPRKILK